MRLDTKEGFYLECVWQELCESELGTDYERKLKSFFQSKPEQLEVVGNTRKDRFVGLTCVSTQRAYDSYSIHTRIK